MGEVIGLDYAAVMAVVKAYDEGKQMFEDIVLCASIEKELA